jgi:serine protease Do
MGFRLVPGAMPCPYGNYQSLKLCGMWNKISLLIIATLPYFGLTINAIAADKTVAKANHSPPDIIAQNIAQSSVEQEGIRIYEQASPAVVIIQTNRGSGSGFIVSSDGLIITNAHVLKDAASPVTIVLANEQKVQADIVGFADNGLDLAAVKIRGASNLPTLSLASSGSIKVGQFAYAIGTPLNAEYQNSFTAGRVSRVDSRRGLIQHDAAINPGNSGGPLLNSQGQVIGVNTSIITPEVRNDQGVIGRSQGNIGISFAIAVDRLQPFLVALRQGNAPRFSQRQQPRPNNQVQNLPLTGQAISDRLGSGDNVLPDNSYYKLYGFEGKAG